MKRLFIIISILLFTGISANGQDVEVPKCPKIKLYGPPGVSYLGQPMKFELFFWGKSESYEVRWTVDVGKITTSRDSRSIDVTGLYYPEGREVHATALVHGLPDGCINMFREKGVIVPVLEGQVIDEFGKMFVEDLKARIDNLYINLQSDPTAEGFIYLYGSKKDVAERTTIIRDHIRFRKLDGKRLILIYAGEEKQIRTRVWIVPKGARWAKID